MRDDKRMKDGKQVEVWDYNPIIKGFIKGLSVCLYGAECVKTKDELIRA